MQPPRALSATKAPALTFAAVQTEAVLRITSMAIDLDAAIEDAEAQIAELDRQRDAAVTRLAELTHLRQGRERSADFGDEPSPTTKARLFADLFRGREDVFAVRWENATKGRSSYSPQCANEWRPGICAKPKVRCGACQRQAFAPLDVHQLLAHLRGQQVVGVGGGPSGAIAG